MPKPVRKRTPIASYAITIGGGFGVEIPKSEEAEFEKNPRAYRVALVRQLAEETARRREGR